MSAPHDLTAGFEEHRPRLTALAHRMLGSRAEAEDAVQETWLRLSRSTTGRADGIENLGGWLTTVTARICLNLLRARRDEPVGMQPPDPEVTGGGIVPGTPADPAQEAVLADEVGLAMLVVLNTLPPAERLTFVLHDLFAVPFDEIARIVGRTPAATRQLASRARRRVRDNPVHDPGPVTPLAGQQAVVEAFLAAARDGDLEGLLALLAPDVVLRPDVSVPVRGADAVARKAVLFSDPANQVRRTVLDGAAGLVSFRDGEPVSALRFTVSAGRITAIHLETSAERLRQLGFR
ncbi:sigma-70 family RNA polymerase sigma factor [Kineosporia sp. J2-2]|uniref:Sigma-70 family RNA polymerase sigma factor n=1 Tax=Kineosporia corallincola TaxID=2835133 RepID=A0ABS5TQG4_9ACTN|nr:sigma-70 family RNA polymerase sigma factor [Kineosporia corallincola]MBT0773260.1 sigma-70 family RNA polymerase sigma factor [Kineosporia corallincola]